MYLQMILKKALDPCTWPLRVKVREYIYYPRKKGQSQDKAAEKGSEPQTLPPKAVDRNNSSPIPNLAPSGSEQFVSDNTHNGDIAVVTSNRYDILSKNDGTIKA